MSSDGSVPGAVALVARGDRVEVRPSARVDVDGTAPMARDSIFRIASITKPIVAAAVMMLVEDGRIALDDPVAALAAGAGVTDGRPHAGRPVDDVVPAVRPITVSDLLTFRAGYGFPSDFSLPAVGPLFSELKQGPPQPQLVAPPDEWMAALSRIPLLHQPGEAWLYNTCSDILGVLIARVSGRFAARLPGRAAVRAARHGRHRVRGTGRQARPVHQLLPARSRGRPRAGRRPGRAVEQHAGVPVRRRRAGLDRRRLARLRPDAARRRNGRGGPAGCCRPSRSGR